MDQKKPSSVSTPPGAAAPRAAGGDSTQTRSRRRFGDGETIVMPLADILRQREEQAFEPAERKDESAGSLNDRTLTRGKTEIISAPLHPRSPSLDIGGNATVVARPNFSASSRASERAPNVTPPGTSATSAADERTRVAVNPQVPAASRPTASAPAANVVVAPPSAKVPIADAPTSPSVAERRQVVAFFGSKGGTGATVLAMNMAHAYARDDLKTCVLDLDLQMGDALAAFGLQSSLVMSDAIQAVLRGEKIADGRLPTHAGGVSVVSQVGSVEDLERINPETLPRLIDALRVFNHTVLIDGLRDFSDNALAVLDAVDKVCLVVVQEVLSIRRARWIFSILRKLGFEPGDVVVVVNRFDAASDIPLESLKRMFEGAAISEITNDPRLALQSLNRGVPLQTLGPQQPITQSLYRLGRFLLGETVAPPIATQAARPVGLWAKLFGRGVGK